MTCEEQKKSKSIIYFSFMCIRDLKDFISRCIKHVNLERAYGKNLSTKNRSLGKEQRCQKKNKPMPDTKSNFDQEYQCAWEGPIQEASETYLE